MDIKAIAHVGRVKDIVIKLLKYGFDDVVYRLDLPGKMVLRTTSRERKEMTTWERIRRVLEELGPTFIKFGQMLGQRPDLLPRSLILELRKLQDEVPPEEYSAIRTQVEKSLQSPIQDIFSSFEDKPLAAGSLAQVHQAELRSGNQVVAVKVQRPNIREVIEKDLYILEVIARQLHERMETARVYDFPNLVRELKKSMRREIDFTLEARNMKIVRENLSLVPGIYIPKVYEGHCTRHVLTMELVKGNKLKDQPLESLTQRKELALAGIHATAKQILEDGFFHADPHPGNLLLTHRQSLCLLDWGMVGRLTKQMRYQIIDLIRAMAEKDSEKVMETLIQMSPGEASPDRRLLQRDLLIQLDTYHSVPIRQFNIGHLMLDITELLREHNMRIPMDLAFTIKALITSEEIARDLYPELDLMEELRPYVRRLTAERWSPREVLRNLRQGIAHLLTFQREFPLRLNHIMERIEQGQIKIRFIHENLGGLRTTLENISNRLVLGIIIGSMIIGSSMIITTGVKPLLFGFPALGVVGYVVSGILGLWLIISIIRSRKY